MSDATDNRFYREKQEQPSSKTQVPTELWVVIDPSDNDSVYSAPWEEACHEHINEAIGEDIDGASSWVVRRYVLSDEPPATQIADGEVLFTLRKLADESARPLDYHIPTVAKRALDAVEQLWRERDDAKVYAAKLLAQVRGAEPPGAMRQLAAQWITDARNNGNGHKESCAYELLAVLDGGHGVGLRAAVPPDADLCPSAADGVHILYAIESANWVQEVGCENCKLVIHGKAAPPVTKEDSR